MNLSPAPPPDIVLIRAERVSGRAPTATGEIWVKIMFDSGGWRYETVPPSQIIPQPGN